MQLIISTFNYLIKSIGCKSRNHYLQQLLEAHVVSHPIAFAVEQFEAYWLKMHHIGYNSYMFANKKRDIS